MSNDVVISVQNLSKRYRIGAKEEGYKTFREAIIDGFTAPIKNLRRLRKLTKFDDNTSKEQEAGSGVSNPLSSASDPMPHALCPMRNTPHAPCSMPPAPCSLPSYPDDTIWALKDVSFEVKQGNVLGIIGRNGAGKSTLLKILSRITEPTSGEVKLYGRVSSLLEVGTGFHPELTGRENIYLNGAILGMRKAEINSKFDEIVDFAEIEKFIDTPVKRYSSGMYVRLAFAVAAHLEPEILMVDEVLAVGDAAFQKKCIRKMGKVSKEGRTVLFVSHNMAAVENLCQSGIVLHQGQVRYIGSQSKAIIHYLKSLGGRTLSLSERTDRVGSGVLRVVGIEIKDGYGNSVDTVASGQDVDIFLYFETTPGFRNCRVIASLMVKTQLDVPVFLHHNRLTRNEFGPLVQTGAFVCHLQRLPLPPSTYRIGYSVLADGSYLDGIMDAAELTVVDGNFFGSSEVPPVSHGVCLVEARWHLISYTTASSIPRQA